MNISKVIRKLAYGYKRIKSPRLMIKVWERSILEDGEEPKGIVVKIVFTIINPTKQPIVVNEAALECGAKLYSPHLASTKFPIVVPAARYSDCEVLFEIDFSTLLKRSFESKLRLKSELRNISEKIYFKVERDRTLTV